MSKSNSIGTKLVINEKAIGGLKSINGIDITADTIDLTSLDNESGYREKAPGFKDVGDVTVSGFLDGDDEGQTECMTLLNSGETKPTKIVFPPKIGMTWAFNASVVRFATGAEVGNGVSFEASFAVSGKPTFSKTGAQGNG